MTGNEFVDLLRSSLTTFHDDVAAFVQSYGVDPLPGSVAATERATYARPESVFTVSAIAGILIESVAEHVTAFVKTITEPVEPIACWTCVRSMLESSSIAAWLYEPGIDVQVRVGRGFAHRYEGMEQQLRLSKAIGRLPADIKRDEQHVNDVENTAVAQGFPRLRNRKGERTGIGQVMPSATEIIKVMLYEEQAYRLLSAVAHGHYWAIQQLSFRQVPDTRPQAGGVATTPFKKHGGTVEGYAYLATRVAKAFGLPIWNQCLYFGWDKERLTAILESAYDRFKGKDAIRFWKS